MNIGDFYDQYVGKVYKFFYIKTLNRHIAEDLTSQTFIALVESLGSKKIDNPQKYLYGIMRNNWTGRNSFPKAN
jgi:DNA-directed RNA polymerase specialized sigma24 family protein